jgi:hypothetical protein
MNAALGPHRGLFLRDAPVIQFGPVARAIGQKIPRSHVIAYLHSGSRQARVDSQTGAPP